MNDWNEWHTAISAGKAIIAARKVGITEEAINNMAADILYFQPEENTKEEAHRAYLEWIKKTEIKEEEYKEYIDSEIDDLIYWITKGKDDLEKVKNQERSEPDDK